MAEAEAAAQQRQDARKCVLIVEDNPLNMKLFSAMIAAEGYDVLQAADGAHALDIARRLHPDLIVMDLQLPGISGLDLTHSLKTDDDTRNIPIIATSAYLQQGDAEKVRESGCDGFIAKPIAISEFLDMIGALIAADRKSRAAPAA